jgi:hypothetical protein
MPVQVALVEMAGAAVAAAAAAAGPAQPGGRAVVVAMVLC